MIDLTCNIETQQLIAWCHQQGVLYINTSVEAWERQNDNRRIKHAAFPTLYEKYTALNKITQKWGRSRGPTAVIDHGANPGLVSHWTKLALEQIALKTLQTRKLSHRRQALFENALQENNFAKLAMYTQTKVIHISERDSQVSSQSKKINECVNTWSVRGFYEEGIALAEIGWGTHESRLPDGTRHYTEGPKNLILLPHAGICCWARSWVPSGEIMGMLIQHGEEYTISQYLTVWKNNNTPLYRPSVYFVYRPADDALTSIEEIKANHMQAQKNMRVMTQDIVEGKDEVGVLLLGHDLQSWWTGSLLDIHETRKLVGNTHNPTVLQVSASLLGAIFWMAKNSNKGFCVPENLPHHEILKIANLYLGPCLSAQTNWAPLPNKDHFGRWEFENFLIKFEQPG